LDEEKALAKNEYMLIDQIWLEQYQEIILALEHEHRGANINYLLDKEVSHLIDLRAMNKIGIFYPNLGNEKTLINNISI